MSVHAQTLRFGAMGTRIEAHLFCDGDAGAALHAVRAVIERVDAVLTGHRPSPLTRLNRRLAEARSAPVDDPLLLDALERAGECHALTGGLFDVTADVTAGLTVAAAGDGTGRRTRWTDVEIDRDAARVHAAAPLGFDFGGFGKGYALDLVRPQLEAAAIGSALVTLGDSSILAYGPHPLGGDWELHVPHPLRPGCTLWALSLADATVSVSSTVANGAERPDRAATRHPLTGVPVRSAVTAIAACAGGGRSEALSTALLLAGPEQRERLRAAAPEARLRHFDFDRVSPPARGDGRDRGSDRTDALDA